MIALIALLKLIPRSALLQCRRLHRQCVSFPSLLWIIHTFSFLAFETACSSVAGLPSVTVNSNAGTSQSTPNTATLPRAGTSTAIVEGVLFEFGIIRDILQNR
jgi:hypothetical protein